MQSIHGLAVHTVLNPTKAAGGVWWVWYTWLHALFAGLYTVKSTKIKQNWVVDFDGLGVVIVVLSCSCLLLVLCMCYWNYIYFVWCQIVLFSCSDLPKVLTSDPLFIVLLTLYCAVSISISSLQFLEKRLLYNKSIEGDFVLVYSSSDLPKVLTSDPHVYCGFDPTVPSLHIALSNSWGKKKTTLQ